MTQPFGIPDREDEMRSLAIAPEHRAEAWDIAIEQASNLEVIGALEQRLHRRIDLLRKREVGCDMERDALRGLAARRDEILAAQGSLASVKGTAVIGPRQDR